MNKKIATLIIYALMVFITVTAYEIYTVFLYGYNIVLGLVGFELFSLITIKMFYRIFEKSVLTRLAIPEEVRVMGVQEALRRQGVAVFYLSVSNTLKFVLMLPFLDPMQNSILLIIFLLVSNLIKVLFAIRLFNYPIKNKKAYYLGLVIVCLAGIGYSINLSNPNELLAVGKLAILLAIFIKSLLEVIDLLLLRYITSAQMAGKRTIMFKL